MNSLGFRPKNLPFFRLRVVQTLSPYLIIETMTIPERLARKVQQLLQMDRIQDALVVLGKHGQYQFEAYHYFQKLTVLEDEYRSGVISEEAFAAGMAWLSAEITQTAQRLQTEPPSDNEIS
ncbi:MAG TPA: hypothetical protein ENJ56_03370 [Anaerolineae bacterium]|nr:hypothetical protein [Anaerolineae bacterium]